MSITPIDEIADIVKRAVSEAEAKGYARGLSDARSQMLAALDRGFGSIRPEPLVNEVDQSVSDSLEEDSIARYNERSVSDRQRAPKGIVPKFVTRVLSEHSGLLPRDFLQFADSEYEKMIRPDSIRSELSSGKTKGRYRTQDGKWFLSEEAEGQTMAGQPSASGNDSNGGSPNAAALDDDDLLN